MLLLASDGVGANFCTSHSQIALRFAVLNLFATALCVGVALGASVVRSTSAYDLIALHAVCYLLVGLVRLARPRGFPL